MRYQMFKIKFVHEIKRRKSLRARSAIKIIHCIYT